MLINERYAADCRIKMEVIKRKKIEAKMKAMKRDLDDTLESNLRRELGQVEDEFNDVVASIRSEQEAREREIIETISLDDSQDLEAVAEAFTAGSDDSEEVIIDCDEVSAPSDDMDQSDNARPDTK